MGWVVFSAGFATNLDDKKARACSVYSRYGWMLFGYFSFAYLSPCLSPFVLESARYTCTLKFSPEGTSNPEQPTNESIDNLSCFFHRVFFLKKEQFCDILFAVVGDEDLPKWAVFARENGCYK